MAHASDGEQSGPQASRQRCHGVIGLPCFVPPQLSQLVKAPPTGDNLAHEIKYDGYRIHARLDQSKVKLLTRTGLDWTDRYETTARAVAKIKAQAAYLDGDLCAVQPDGTTSFAELQAATDAHRATNLVYFVFDLLFLNGAAFTWQERSSALTLYLPDRRRPHF
jgi:ATP-dependent DNA ligase